MNFDQAAAVTTGHAATLNFDKAVKISSGERVNFEKSNPGVKKLRIELYWESTNDGDVTALYLDDAKQSIPKGVAYGRGTTVVPGLTHSGDVTSSGDKDPTAPEETIKVDLDAFMSGAGSLLVIASTHYSLDDPSKTPVPFGKLRDCRLLVINDENNEVLYSYELDEDFSTFTSVEMLSIYPRNGEFRLTSMGEGVGTGPVGLNNIAEKYNITEV